MGLSVLMFLVTFVYPFSFCSANFSAAGEETAQVALHNPGIITTAVGISLFIIAVIYFVVLNKLRRFANSFSNIWFDKGASHDK